MLSKITNKRIQTLLRSTIVHLIKCGMLRKGVAL